jgi:hypothetical protein
MIVTIFLVVMTLALNDFSVSAANLQADELLGRFRTLCYHIFDAEALKMMMLNRHAWKLGTKT